MRSLFGVCVTVIAFASIVPAQAERPVLDIPDSLVIPGRTTYEQITEGAKEFAYYGRAFPEDRLDTIEPPQAVTTLPPLASKDVFPVPVRHGGVRAATSQIAAQHYGNVLASGRYLRDWHGYLSSVDGELGGGYGHVDGAGWHRERLSARTRKMVSWWSGYTGEVDLINMRTGVWGMDTTSHRDAYDVAARVGGDVTVFGDHRFRVRVEAHQRGVSSPSNDASEQFVDSRVSWQKANGRFFLKGSGRFAYINTDRDLGATGAAKLVSVGAEAWTRLEENFGGAMGVTVYSVDYLAGDSLRTIRPSLSAWARLFDVKLTARLSSSIEPMGVYRAYRDNTMLDLATPLRMPFSGVDVDVNAKLPIGRWNELSAGTRVLMIDDYAVWQRAAAGKPYEIELGKRARATTVYGRYFHTWLRGTADVLLLWREHNVQDTNDPVPFLADWEAHFATSYLTSFRSITVTPTVELIGTRSYYDVTTSPASIGKLDPYYLVNLEMRMPVRRGWDVGLSVLNVLNQEYDRYDGVCAPGFHVQMSARKVW